MRCGPVLGRVYAAAGPQSPPTLPRTHPCPCHLARTLDPEPFRFAGPCAKPCCVQVLGVVQAAGPGLQSARAWRTICALLANMALHPDAAPIALDALQLAAAPDRLSVASFIPVLECASQIAERNCAVSLPDPSYTTGP